MNKHLDSIMSCKEKSRKTFRRLFSFLDNGCYCLLKVCKEKSRKTFHRFFFLDDGCYCLLKVCYSQTCIKLPSTGNGKVTT